jgi:uncharacterized protein
MPESRGGMTVKEAGRKGGQATKKNHGTQFYQTIGRTGGETTKLRHGPDYYVKIGKKGGERLRDLVAKGKSATK